MSNMFEYVVSCAVHIFEYIAGLCIQGPSSYKSIFMVYTERRVKVSCSVYDMLHKTGRVYLDR